jgi:hypothetical protein
VKLLLIKGLHGEDFFLLCNNFEDLKNVFYMLSFMSRHKRLLKIESGVPVRKVPGKSLNHELNGFLSVKYTGPTPNGGSL